MATRVPKDKGKPGKAGGYDVIDHELKPYQPKLIDAYAISDKIIRKKMGVSPDTPSPEPGKTYIKKK